MYCIAKGNGMTPTAWADLPNAKHIDRILADLKKNTDRWSATRNAASDATRNAAVDAAWNAARNAARTAAWNAAWDAVWDAARGAAWDAAWTAAWDAVWDATRDATRSAASDAAWTAARTAARGAILALIAYDDCAYLLDEKPEHVQMLGLLGNEKALLLYQACLALQKEMA